MSQKEPKRQPEEEAPRKSQEQASPGSGEPAAGESAAKSSYVFKIVRADPKNDFDFENVADK